MASTLASNVQARALHPSCYPTFYHVCAATEALRCSALRPLPPMAPKPFPIVVVTASARQTIGHRVRRGERRLWNSVCWVSAAFAILTALTFLVFLQQLSITWNEENIHTATEWLSSPLHYQALWKASLRRDGMRIRWISEVLNPKSFHLDRPYALGFLVTNPTLSFYARVVHMAQQLSHQLSFAFDVFIIFDSESEAFVSAAVVTALCTLARETSLSLPCSSTALHLPGNLYFLQVNQSVCINRGFWQLDVFHAGAPSGRDKSLYAFTQWYPHYEFVWLIEEDVFIPSIEAFLDLHRLAMPDRSHLRAAADVVTSPVPTRLPLQNVNVSEWHWDKVVPLASRVLPPTFNVTAGYVCVLGLSRTFLVLADEFALTHGRFFFLESFFTTMGSFWNLSVLLPAQLDSNTIKGSQLKQSLVPRGGAEATKQLVSCTEEPNRAQLAAGWCCEWLTVCSSYSQ